MGQVCSGSAVGKQVAVARDPSDQELDAVEMKEVKIPDFDSFFERAAAPLNELVEIHNGIYLSEENLKAAAAAMQGETQVRITLTASGRVQMCLWRFDDKEREEILTQELVDEKLSASVDLHDAYNHTQTAIDSLNQALEQPTNTAPTNYIVKRGRLFITTKGDQDLHVRDVNITLFTLRKELALQAHISSLSEAMAIFVKELAKVEDPSSLSVITDDSGAIKIMAGDHELDLKKIEGLSQPAMQFRDALVELLENVQTAATSVPELVEQTNAFVAEAQQFPGKVPEAASSAELGMMEIPKAAMATSSNVQALSTGPRIASSTTTMIKYAARELHQGVAIPIGA
ncbi:hypothetical protein Poli38472_011545 [Pythium oligandrum]|uniref:Uncharacterized protein n=1 Tax=Pythium oligandrum TaxID=41045 RepID=A0A8K1FI67_PYTOL|nr:hypothetical protein Poli38472_011545 [Pythium oligandrum]|eukprot:TMW64665.1 hypothetical protein Poli38472_011545 [Pythium oligandrum]